MKWTSLKMIMTILLGCFLAALISGCVGKKAVFIRPGTATMTGSDTNVKCLWVPDENGVLRCTSAKVPQGAIIIYPEKKDVKDGKAITPPVIENSGVKVHPEKQPEKIEIVK